MYPGHEFMHSFILHLVAVHEQERRTLDAQNPHGIIVRSIHMHVHSEIVYLKSRHIKGFDFNCGVVASVASVSF